MALVSGDLTVLHTARLGKGYRLVVGKWTPSGTYTSGGEDLTTAIAAAKLGLSTVDSLNFTPLTADTPSTYALVSFDHKPATSSLGKIHVASSVPAHTHNLLIKGGQIGSTTNDIAHYATDILGKEAATDATILGSASATKGGVLLSTAGTVGVELAAGTDLATGIYTCRFVAYGLRA